MRAPDWWWQPRPTVTAWLLAPLGAGYGALTAARMARSGVRLGVPVICVGNLVAGGAGKTPTALAIAVLLQKSGARPAFLSRGYGGTSGRAVLRVDPALHRAAQAGDEPLLLAAAAPTFVGADRRLAAQAAVAAGADVLIMDDGLQNPSLAKAFALAVIDGRTGLGNGLCLPAGPLRAPPPRQWPFLSAVCVIGDGPAGAQAAALATAAGKPVLTARLAPDPAVIDALRGRRLLAFAGIGRPSKFTDTLREEGLDVVGLRAFPDHHPFSAADRDGLQRDAAAAGALLVTTAKDRVRLPPDFPAQAVPVGLVFDRPADLRAALSAALRAHHAGKAVA